MIKKGILSCLAVSASLFLGAPYRSAEAETIRINEIVVDPKSDHNGSGSITSSDEFVELYNFGGSPVDVTDWKLKLEDGNDKEKTLDGIIGSGDYMTIINPPGVQKKDDGRISLLDALLNEVDSVQYGNWNNGLNNAPTGDATSYLDESLSRISDTGNDYNDFIKTRATLGYENVPEPGSLVLLGIGGISGLMFFGKRKR